MTAKIKLNAASGGGSFSLQAPSSSAYNRVFTLPDVADATMATLNGISEFDQWYLTSDVSNSGNDAVIEQIVKQLDKLVDVIEVSEITSSDHIEREIVFVKIKDSDTENENLKSLKTNEFLKIHKAENGHAIIECVDSPENVNEFINTVKDIAIKIIRSGAVGIGS